MRRNRLVGSLKSYVSFAEYSLFYRALLADKLEVVGSGKLKCESDSRSTNRSLLRPEQLMIAH